MEFKVINGEAIFDISELLMSLKGEDRISLIDSLACCDEVIKSVADQIMKGWTELGSHGYRGSAESPHTPLDKVVRYVAERPTQKTIC